MTLFKAVQRARTIRQKEQSRSAFTLVEVLISSAILILILVLTAQITNSTSGLWQRTRARIETFQEARAGFESMTRRLSQAMLGTYWDYVDAGGNPRVAGDANFVPKQYVRQSDLHFLSGPATDLLAGVKGSSGDIIQTTSHAVFFQAPLGYSTATTSSAQLQNLLNVSGYFIEYSDDKQDRPKFLQTLSSVPLNRRYRLVEMSQPTEKLEVYEWTSQGNASILRNWYVQPLNDQPSRRVLAENIIALILQPKRATHDTTGASGATELAPEYLYDTRGYQQTSNTATALTRNQLPPVIQVTMVAIDEKSANRLDTGSTPPDFGVAGKFANAANYQKDLEELESKLVEMHVDYRVLTTEVSILQAKWSEK